MTPRFRNICNCFAEMKLHLKSSVSLSRLEDGCRSASSEAASAEKPCGQQSCASSAVPASGASPHPARRAHRVIASCAEAMAHKPEQISLLQAPISRMWSFDARESCGQIRAAAVSVRSAFPGLLLTTLPPSAAAGKGTDLRSGGSGSIPPLREAPCRRCSGRCFPIAALCNHADNSE